MALFKYFTLIKKQMHARSAGGLCTFPCSCRGGRGRFRIVTTYTPSHCLRLLRQENVPVYRVRLLIEILPWGSGLVSSPWPLWVYYSEGSGLVLSWVAEADVLCCELGERCIFSKGLMWMSSCRAGAFLLCMFCGRGLKICLWSWQREFWVCCILLVQVL